MSTFLLQMYIALDELIAANRSAKLRGITLIHDGQRSGAVIDMYEAEHELNKLTHALATGAYIDHRNRGVVVIEGLCHVVLVFNKTCNKFKELGFEITDRIFDGHYYKSMNTCIRAIELLCQAKHGDVLINSELEQLEVNNYSSKATYLYHKYATAITQSLKELENAPDDHIHMFDLPVKYGKIQAVESVDRNNPGVALYFYDEEERKEYASCLMEYNQNKDTILLHVWSPNDPDGDPVYVIDMKNKEDI